MEQISKIVELYPVKLFNLDKMKTDPTIDVSYCHLGIKGRRFTRTIYRPPTGPDLLLAQSKEAYTYNYYRQLPIAATFSRLSLYNIVLQNEAHITDERLLDDRNSNPGWSWRNVAEGVSRHIDEKGFFLEGKEPEPFYLWAQEAFGTLTILDGRWNHIADPETAHSEETTQCYICYDEDKMTDEDSIMLHCQHVFHKHCLFPTLWKKPKMKCAVCKRQLFL